MRPSVNSWRVTLVEISIGSSPDERRRWLAGVADAPKPIADAVNGGGHTVWVERGELVEMRPWLQAVRGLDGAPEIAVAEHELEARWRFPDAPLVGVWMDGSPLAECDYRPASGSAHWALTWLDERASSAAANLPLLPLSAQVPEAIDEDPRMRLAAAEAAADAVASTLFGRPVRLALDPN